ncbi:MAG TPA: methionyl-tRNA formyltransferase [Gemmatimonadaceae bacterium]|nr:methionyl-tRNA formyltransferase [Gemmatimonadaceae bacterium]
MSSSLRLVYWGTPEFATPPLRALLGEGFDVVGVVTQPDKPVGRSRSKLEAPPVKRLALDEGIPVLQPEKPRGVEFEARLRELEPDASVVVAYGHIIPKAVLDLPTSGSFNVHASLLPALRGAAPIQGAILEGLTETGVTIMRMVPALDAGPIVLQVRTPVPDDETYGELQLRLSELGALALVEAMTLVALGRSREEPQDDSLATYAPKIERESARIDWSRGAIAISRAIRAYDPRPGAFTTHRGAPLKLFGVRILPTTGAEPGTIVDIDADGMVVATEAGAVRVAQVQPAGKTRMTPVALARGRGIAVGDRLGSEHE